MSVSIYIPLPEHLVCFLKYEAGTNTDKIKVSKRSEFGAMVLNWLQWMPDDASPKPPEESHLELVINKRYTDGCGNWIHPEKLRMIRIWVARNYEREFLHFVREHRTIYGLKKQDAIMKWRERIGITEQMRTFESDLREVHRKKLA